MSKAQKLLSIMAEAEIFQKGPYVFTTAGLEGNKVLGTLAYQGKAYTGYFANNEGDVDWQFRTPLPDNVASDDAFIDLASELLSYHNDGLEIE